MDTVLEVVLLVGAALLTVGWIAALVGVAVAPQIRWRKSQRNKGSTFLLVLVTGWIGALYFWFWVRSDLLVDRPLPPPVDPRWLNTSQISALGGYQALELSNAVREADARVSPATPAPNLLRRMLYLGGAQRATGDDLAWLRHFLNTAPVSRIGLMTSLPNAVILGATGLTMRLTFGGAATGLLMMFGAVVALVVGATVPSVAHARAQRVAWKNGIRLD